MEKVLEPNIMESKMKQQNSNITCNQLLELVYHLYTIAVGNIRSDFHPVLQELLSKTEK